MPEPRFVLIAVFDGLRPDFVRPDWTPFLWQLRQEGVWCSRSHCVFPSVTRVNASALVTGSYPAGHGIASNTVWRPQIDDTRPLHTNDRADLLRIEAARGRLLARPTLGEVLAAHGQRMIAVGSGSAGSTHLLHPAAEACGGAVAHTSFCAPDALAADLDAALGPWPGDDLPYPDQAVARVRHGLRALAEHLAPALRPTVGAFWCTVPDGPHHRFGLGDPRSVDALQQADAAFADAVQALHTLYEVIDIIVTADHGYVTIADHLDIEAALRGAGLIEGNAATDPILCVDGGAVSIYLRGGAPAEALTRFLLAQPWATAVFSPGGRVPGTLPLEASGGGGPDAPDLLLCLTWSDGPNEHGVGGSGWGAGSITVGGGDHGGFSPWEMRNTLLLAGPSFRRGVENDLPAGIVDVAPTVLRLFDLTPPEHWDGRILDEALADNAAALEAGIETLSADCDTAAGTVRQTLRLEAAGVYRYPLSVSKMML